MEVSGHLCASVALLLAERDHVTHLMEGWVEVGASLTFRSAE
jgi:hypothetical protein